MSAEERAKRVRLIRRLMPVQRAAVEALMTTVSRADALSVLRQAGYEVNPRQLARWQKQRPFQAALEAREEELAKTISKNSVVKNANALLEVAMRPKPILYKGKHTGFEDVNVGAALTANEQLGKIAGAFVKDEAARVAVVIDIDFSGRKEPVVEMPAIEAEFEEVKPGEDFVRVTEFEDVPAWLE